MLNGDGQICVNKNNSDLLKLIYALSPEILEIINFILSLKEYYKETTIQFPIM